LMLRDMVSLDVPLFNGMIFSCQSRR